MTITPAEKAAAIAQIADASVVCEACTSFPAAVSVAQAILESYYLKSMPPDSNNCFGIKATDNHESYTFTKEWINGEYQTLKLAFEAYPTLGDCFKAHAHLLTGGIPYKDAWFRYLANRDVTQFVQAFAKKYATEPKYAALLLGLMRQNNITEAIASARAKRKAQST